MSSSLNIGSNTVGLSSILKEGIKSYKGLDQATLRNIHACLELGDLLRTSFGPCGRNKLLLNNLDKALVTSDAQTIMQEAGVVHPAAKLLMQVAQQQSAEVGDGAALVVTLTAALLGKAGELIQLGVRPGVIRDGFNAGISKALELLDDLVVENVVPDWKNADAKTLQTQLMPLLKPVIASKQLGLEDFLSELAAEALAHAIPCDAPERFDLDNVRIVKIMGASVLQSQVIHGLVLNRKVEGPLPKGAARVAVYSCPLDIARTETKGTVLLKSADQMKAFSKDEERSLEADLKAIAETGAQLLITSDTVSDLALHFMERLGLASIKVTSKFDLRRIVRATGARALTSLRPPKAEELGTTAQVSVMDIGSDSCTILKNDQSARVSTILLRGSSTNVMEDYERSILNGISVARAVLMAGDGRLVPGAGACEMELAGRLGEWALASGLTGLPLMSLQYFSEAFSMIPQVLAENAGYEPVPYMAALEAAHMDRTKITFGVHPDEMEPVEVNVRDALVVKRKAVMYAGRVAALILGVDQIIMAKQVNPGGPDARANRPADLD